jgi:hypothetical protein
MKGVNERGRWKLEPRCLKQFMCHYHISFKLTRLHVSSDEELNYKSWLLRIAIGTLIGWNSIIIEQSRKCKTSLEMSSCKISTFFTVPCKPNYIWIIIVIFFRRPNAFLFGPNKMSQLCKAKGKNEAMERHATSSKTIHILSAKKSHERCERKRSLKTWIKMFQLFPCRYHRF